MERSTLFALAGVALGGAALAVVALVATGTLPIGTPESVVESVAEVSAPGPRQSGGQDASEAPELRLPEVPAREGRAVQLGGGSRSRPDVPGDAGAPAGWSPPPDALTDAGLDDVFEDEKALLTADPFADLPPGSSDAALSRRVDQVLGDVDRIASEYERAATRVEPEDATQVLDRAALLYEHVAGAIPTHPPTTGTPEEMTAWHQRHEALIQRVRGEADRLRQLARDEAEVAPPEPDVE